MEEKMSVRIIKPSIRSSTLAFIYLFNSLVLYVRPVYEVFYTRINYSYIGIALLIIAILSMNSFHVDIKSIILSLLIILVGLVDIQFNNLPIGELLSLVWFLVFIYLFSQLSENETKNPLFSATNLFFWVYLVVYAISYHSKYLNESEFEDILNPNTVGTGIAQFALLGNVTWNRSIKKKILIYIISLIGIYLCNSRAAMLILFGAIVVGYIMKRSKMNYLLLMKLGIISVIILGLILPYIYIQLWYKLGTKAQFMGKNLFTGRERIWASLFEYMEVHPQSYLWGAGKEKILFWHEKYNLHNGYLAIFTEYGAIVSILFWGFLVSILFSRYTEIQRKRSIIRTYQKRRNKDIDTFSFVLFSLVLAYTETNYTYILSTIYLSFAYGILARRGQNDTQSDPLLLVWGQ